MNTLAVFTGGIGDTLLAGPAFAALHQHGPLDIAGLPERLTLIHAAGACNAIVNMDRIEFHTIFTEPSDRLRQFIKDYNRVIVLMHDDGTIRNALFELGVSDCRVFPGIPPEGWPRHATEYYGECISQWLPSRAEFNPFKLRVDKGAKHDIIIHPGSGGMHKNWPLENFAAVAQGLGRDISWLRGPAEESIPLPPNTRVVEPMPLLELAGTLAAANAYLGNDSGITHLAAAVGCPTVAIFGPTDPRVWAPQGDRVTALRGDPWPDVASVITALRET